MMGRRSFQRATTRALCAHPLATIGIVLALLYWPWVAALPLDGTLEGNRLEAAREMLSSGDWLVPRLGGTVYLAKPPLHPWSIALLALPLGEVTLWLGRSLSVVSALLLALVVFRFARRELGRRAALFATLALGSALLVVEKAVRAELELELTLWTTAALVLFFDGARCPGRRRAWTRLIAAGLALGAATLTKGPPPLIVFACAALTLALAPERRRIWISAALPVLALAAAVFLAWGLPAGARLGFPELWAAFDVQFTERLTRPGRTNVEPFWFYAPALCVALLPAVLYAPVLWLVRPASMADARARERARFLWGWALVPCLLFSLSSGKETRYLLPMLPGWALLLGWGWRRARALGRLGAWRHALVLALARASWVMPVLWLLLGWHFYTETRTAVVASALAALLLRSLVGWSLAHDHAWATLLALAGLLATGKYAWAENVVARKRDALPIAELAADLRARLAPEEPWILLGPYRSWLHFSVARPCLSMADWSALRDLQPGEVHLVLALEPAIPPGEQGLVTLGRWTVDGDPYQLVEFTR